MPQQAIPRIISNPGLKADLKAMLEFGIWWESRPGNQCHFVRANVSPKPDNHQDVNGEAA